MKPTPEAIAIARYDFLSRTRDHLAGYLESPRGQDRLGEYAIELLAATQDAQVVAPHQLADGRWLAQMQQLDPTEAIPISMVGRGDRLLRDSIAPTARQYRTIARYIGEQGAVRQVLLRPTMREFRFGEHSLGETVSMLFEWNGGENVSYMMMGRPYVMVRAEQERIPVTACTLLHELSHASDRLSQPLLIAGSKSVDEAQQNETLRSELKAYTLEAAASHDLLAHCKEVLPLLTYSMVALARHECNGDWRDNPLAFEPTPRVRRLLAQRGLAHIYS